MQQISVEELNNKKILPFDIYNEKGEVILSAGEILTPGKMLQLRYIPAIFKKEVQEEKAQKEEEKTPEIKPASKEEKAKPFTINVKVKKEIQELYKKALEISAEKGAENNKQLYSDIRDKIIEETIPILDNVIYKSQLKIDGDYSHSHGVNVAILSTALCHRLRLDERETHDIVMGAMLHDIGKTRIPSKVFEKVNPTAKETQLIEIHTQVGYRIIRDELGLPENIARIALEHHERNDGSGYPKGISGDLISRETQIVSVCNVYDSLICNRGPIRVKNSKEAMKAMLEIGSRWFMTDVLYTFVHMTNFNDLTPVSDE